MKAGPWAERARLFADLARDLHPQPCDFPQLGRVTLRHRIGTSHTGAGRWGDARRAAEFIGEHTDYSGGFVLPASLALGTWTVVAARDDGKIRVLSEGQHETAELPLNVAPGAARKSWSDYIAGVTWWYLQQAGCKLRGADLLIASDVLMGSGLSSSAALEVSVARALLAASMVKHSVAHGEYNVRRAESEELAERMRRRFLQRERLADLSDSEVDELQRLHAYSGRSAARRRSGKRAAFELCTTYRQEARYIYM